MTGRGSNGGKAMSLVLFFKKFGGEWSYKNVYFIFVLFSVILLLLFCFVFDGRTCSHCKSSSGGSIDRGACITERGLVVEITIDVQIWSVLEGFPSHEVKEIGASQSNLLNVLN